MAKQRHLTASEPSSTPKTPIRIAILHPDLGIGGAERFIVDLAIGLQASRKTAYEIEIFTSSHDVARAFSETIDGTLKVTVLPSLSAWTSCMLPRHVFGTLYTPCAILRQVALVFSLYQHRYVQIGRNDQKKSAPFDMVIMDQISASIPLIHRLLRLPVLFYIHFPDKLLANGDVAPVDAEGRPLYQDLMSNGNSLPSQISSLIKNCLRKAYRVPLDLLEDLTTASADTLVVNSSFTGNVVRHCMPNLKDAPLHVVWPSLNIDAYDPLSNEDLKHADLEIFSELTDDRTTLLSLNRFEKKKNIPLAISAYIKVTLQRPDMKNIRLVLAGACDPRLPGQVAVHKGLQATCDRHNLVHRTINMADPAMRRTVVSQDVQVLFLLNYSDIQRSYLLHHPSTKLLLYTPTNEHFGIVPLEAMLCSLPVLCVKSGGPIESVIESKTGFLRPSDPDEWAKVILAVMDMPDARGTLGVQGAKRTREEFSLTTMIDHFEPLIQKTLVDSALYAAQPVLPGLFLAFITAMLFSLIAVYLYHAIA